MNRISAIVCFGLPESQVDMLIEATMGTAFEPSRWVVFGVDVNLLGALDKQWGKAIDLVLALLPGTSEELQDAALTILEHEGVLASESVWVRGPDVPASAPQGMLAVFDAKGFRRQRPCLRHRQLRRSTRPDASRLTRRSMLRMIGLDMLPRSARGPCLFIRR